MDQVSLLAAFLGVLPSSSEETVLRLLIETGAMVVGADEGSLLVLDPECECLRFAMTIGSEESQQALLGQKVPLGEGITGLAAETLEVQIGAPTYLNVEQTKERGGAKGAPEAVMAAPMLVGETLVGVITAVSFAKSKRFSSKDASLYANFAAIAGLVVDQGRRLLAQSREAPTLKSLGKDEERTERIMRSIASLASIKPDGLQRLARIMDDIAALAGQEEY